MVSALLGIGAAGCSTSDLVNDPTLALSMAAPPQVAADDPRLPDAVSLVPELLGRTDAPELAATPAVAAQPAPEVAVMAVAAPIEAAAIAVPAAFSGPAPDRPATDFLAIKRPIAARSPELDALIARYAEYHQIPLTLLRRVVNRESTFNPAARNGPYWGLMQILPATARSMGYDGSPEGLLDAETNLIYAGKYLKGAFLVAGGDQDRAVRLYARGYYYDAKRAGLLEATGLRAPRRARVPEPVQQALAASARTELPGVAGPSFALD